MFIGLKVSSNFLSLQRSRDKTLSHQLFDDDYWMIKYNPLFKWWCDTYVVRIKRVRPGKQFLVPWRQIYWIWWTMDDPLQNATKVVRRNSSTNKRFINDAGTNVMRKIRQKRGNWYAGPWITTVSPISPIINVRRYNFIKDNRLAVFVWIMMPAVINRAL